MTETEDRDKTSARTEGGGAVPDRLIEGITSHALFMLDAEGTITTWPAPAESLYGYDAGTVLGAHVRRLFADEEDQYAAIALGDVLADAKGEPVEVEHWHERADGSVFWGTLTLSPVRDGEFRGFAAVCKDRTTTKEYERMLERQNDRLKEFTDILAHDLRNPLDVIDGRLTLYAETGDDEHLRTIDETTDRMSRLVEDLLRVARQGNVVEDPESTDVEDVIETAWEGVGHGRQATLEYEEVGPVSADPDRLCELFANLFRNSVEHGGDDVAVTVGPLESGFYVADDGPGLDDAVRENAFDHGVTTAVDGSGYGLSVVRTIVNAHGWEVETTEDETGGARFEVTGIEFLG